MTAAYPLPPISDADWPQEIADLSGGFAGQLNVYRTMAHDPALLRAWAGLRQHIVRDSALGLELVEVVILRTRPAAERALRMAASRHPRPQGGVRRCPHCHAPRCHRGHGPGRCAAGAGGG